MSRFLELLHVQLDATTYSDGNNGNGVQVGTGRSELVGPEGDESESWSLTRRGGCRLEWERRDGCGVAVSAAREKVEYEREWDDE
jgi:hypothetical protein